MIQIIKGDLTETDCKIIAHGVNCQNVMGSGVARALFEKWPKVKTQYHKTYEIDAELGFTYDYLGTIQSVSVEKEKIVLNCFTQEYFGNDGMKYLSYDALVQTMNKAHKFCKAYSENQIAIPKIGCGLAGGDWTIVEAILNSIFPSDFTVKVYIKD